MTPLSDALTAAQRSALAALEKAYVAEQLSAKDFDLSLKAVGISDPVDTAFLVASLDVLREWGVAAPTMTERVAEVKVEPATDKQLTLIKRLCEEKAVEFPDASLTKAEASKIIEQLKDGTYVVGVCPRCDFDRTGNDPRDDEERARMALRGAESDSERAEG